MKTFIQYLRESAEVKALKHLYHPEELIYMGGYAGVNIAIEFIRQTALTLHKKESNVKVSRKIDGAPSCVFGHIDGKFFVGSKSVFNAVPKINYTDNDIDVNHAEAPGLARVLKIALQYLAKVTPNNNMIYQGDFIFDTMIRKDKTIDGVESYVFRPNTITYAVGKGTELGERIGKAKMGIVVHTYYMGLHDSAKFAPDLSGFKTNKDVVVLDAKVDIGTSMLLSDIEYSKLTEMIDEMTSINDHLKSVNFYGSISNTISTIITKFHNKLIREGIKINPEKTFSDLVAYSTSELQKEVDKVKTQSTKEKKVQNLQKEISILESNRASFIKSLVLYNLILDCKQVMIERFNYMKMFGTFIDDGKTFEVTNDEGFVLIGDGTVVKLVDRMNFSRINFNLAKTW